MRSLTVLALKGFLSVEKYKQMKIRIVINKPVYDIDDLIAEYFKRINLMS